MNDTSKLLINLQLRSQDWQDKSHTDVESESGFWWGSFLYWSMKQSWSARRSGHPLFHWASNLTHIAQ